MCGPGALLQATVRQIFPPCSFLPACPPSHVVMPTAIRAPSRAAASPLQQKTLLEYDLIQPSLSLVGFALPLLSLCDSRNPDSSFRTFPSSSSPSLKKFFLKPPLHLQFLIVRTFLHMKTRGYWFLVPNTMLPTWGHTGACRDRAHCTAGLCDGSHDDLQHVTPRICLLSSCLGFIPNPGSSLCFSMDNQQSLH